MMKPYIEFYPDLFEYIFGYAWIRFYFEESIKKSYCKTTDPFIFNANTAATLPSFHFNIKRPNDNPYMPINVATNSLRPEFNIGSMEVNWNNHKSVICNFEEFKSRFNVFCTGNSSNDLFQNIDFKKMKMGVTGSIMTACMQRDHPLVKLFTLPQYGTFDAIYNRYFTEYYCESDIDVMIKTNDIFEFMDIAREMHNSIALNILSFNNHAEMEHTKLVYEKNIYLFVTEEFIKDKFSNSSIPYEVIMSNLNSENIKNKWERN